MLFPFLSFITIIVIVIVVIVSNRLDKKSKKNIQKLSQSQNTNAETEHLNQEILAELNKPEPDFEKLKMLRSKMNSLQETVANNTPVNNAPNTVSSNTQKKNSSNDSNLNGLSVALLVGSLFILAGVAGITVSGITELGLMLLILMAIIFYCGGIILKRNQTLKIVSYVFVGTGMMILPFIGILVHEVTNLDPSITWLIFSLISVPMYLFATYTMKSKVFSYFAILAFVSFCSSLSSVMGLAMMWYFVFVMILGIIMDFIIMFGPSKKLGVMEEPVRQAGEWLPLAAFIASIGASGISETEYVIMFGIITLQLILNYAHKQDLMRETLLRMSLMVLLLMVVHLIDPSGKTMGITLALCAFAQAMFSIFKISKNADFESGRREVESLWILIELVSFIGAGSMIGSYDQSSTLGWITGAIAVDSILLLIARYGLKDNGWCIGLIVAGIVFPLTLLNALSLYGTEAAPFYILAYTLEGIGFEALLWKNSSKDAGVLTATGIVAFGIMSLIMRNNFASPGLVFLLMAIGFGVRGLLKKQNVMQEISIYLVGCAIYSTIITLVGDDIQNYSLVVFGHIGFICLMICSFLWEKKERIRMLLGCILLLFTVGMTAIIHQLDLMMYLFLIETVSILIGGIVFKQKNVWITGAIGAFLAVLWFTKDLPFVMPVLFGIGIIVAVVIILLFNDRKKNLPKQ